MERIKQARLAIFERTLARLDKLARLRGRDAKLPEHLALGIEGEDAVFFYLRRRRYTVVARRWSSGDLPGDVDLIAWDGSVLCFIEVKTRSARTITPAEVAVDERKRTILRRLARRYVRQLPQATAPPVRFDVVSVYLVPGRKPEFEHYKAAFSWSEDPRD